MWNREPVINPGVEMVDEDEVKGPTSKLKELMSNTLNFLGKLSEDSLS